MPCTCFRCLHKARLLEELEELEEQSYLTHCDSHCTCNMCWSHEEEDVIVQSYARHVPKNRMAQYKNRSHLPIASHPSLHSVRSLNKSRASLHSVNGSVYYNHDLGDYVSRGVPYGGGDKTIVFEKGGKGDGATAVEISDEKSGTTTTVLSSNGRHSSRRLRKSVSWRGKIADHRTISPARSHRSISSSSSSSSSSDSSSDSSSSSDEYDSRSRSRHGRGRGRGRGRSRSHSRSRSRGSRSRSGSRHRSRSRDRFYAENGYAMPYQQPHTRIIPTPIPVNMAYQQNPYMPRSQLNIGPALLTAPPGIPVQQVPQMLTHDGMGVHNQYYPGRGMPMVGQPIHAGLPMGSPYVDVEEDQG